MALQSILIPPDAARDGRARALVGYVCTWPLWTLKQQWGSFEAGTTFRRAYGSKGARYLVNSVVCECPDYAEWKNVCKHIRAVVMWEAQQAPAASHRDALAAWVDEQARSTANRAGVLGYLDAVSEGANHEAARAAGHRARVRYEDIFGED